MLGRPTLVKTDPLFDSIRGEPEFQQIVPDVEAKYQAEHERVRQWLEENDMLYIIQSLSYSLYHVPIIFILPVHLVPL